MVGAKLGAQDTNCQSACGMLLSAVIFMLIAADSNSIRVLHAESGAMMFLAAGAPGSCGRQGTRQQLIAISADDNVSVAWCDVHQK